MLMHSFRFSEKLIHTSEPCDEGWDYADPYCYKNTEIVDTYWVAVEECKKYDTFLPMFKTEEGFSEFQSNMCVLDSVTFFRFLSFETFPYR